MNNKIKPNGKLIAVGGSIEKDIEEIDDRLKADFGEEVILEEIIKHAGGKDSRFEIITSATDEPEEAGDEYRKIFSQLGVENLDILYIQDRGSANSSQTLERIKKADVVLFTGGNQNQIIDYMIDTDAYNLIKDRYLNEELVIAGTSAGAAMMGEKMVEEGKETELLMKNDLNMGTGLGFIKEILFDTHFIQRGRFARLAEALAEFPDKLGIGLDANTGIIIKEGNICKVIGSGMVTLIDASDFDYDNYQKLKDETPLSLLNLKVHVMASNDTYYINEKKAQAHYDERDYKRSS